MLEQTATIAAISTGAGNGVGMVRLSGPSAILVAGRVFRPMSPEKTPDRLRGYTGALGRVFDAEGEIDEAVIFVYRAPHSYTGEDVVELCCHGGRFVLEKTLAAVIRAGAVPAVAGEFTKRAVLGGKMTLTEAESVADILAAQSRQALGAALEQRDGALFRAVMEICDRLLDQLSHIAAWLDYPEEDVEAVQAAALQTAVEDGIAELSRLERSYDKGLMLREGIATAIVGSANVGKSTLMNLLAGSERSIVTEIPGTTRDVVEESVRVGEILLRLCDTAGIRDTDDAVERIGVEKSRALLARADLVLAVFDGSRPLSAGDLALLAKLKGRRVIGILNKTDLAPAFGPEALAPYLNRVVELSAKTGEGLAELEAAVSAATGLAQLDPAAGMVANQRQLACVVAAREALAEAAEALRGGLTLDAVSSCLEEAADRLLELTGQKAGPQIIDRVFERFCVGK